MDSSHGFSFPWFQWRDNGPEHIITADTFNDTIDRLPLERLHKVKELKIDKVLSPEQFFSFLARCPNLTGLSCEVVREFDFVPEPSVVPQLRRLKAPPAVISVLLPGRPIDELVSVDYMGDPDYIDPDNPPAPPPNYGIAGLHLLTAGSTPLRSLELQTFQWSEDLLETLHALFPELNTLKLDFAPKKGPKGQLDKCVLDAVRLWNSCDFHTIGFTVGLGNTPPPEEILEQQRAKLIEARIIQPRLKAVTLHGPVNWQTDDQGLWTATCVGNREVTRTLLSPLDYMSPIAADGSDLHSEPPVNSAPPLLPPELLVHVITVLQLERRGNPAPHWGILGTLIHANAPPHPQDALKSLSLTSRALRSIAQPALFDHVEISGSLAECAFRAKRLERMFDARPESTGWIKFLRLCNLLPPLQLRHLPNDEERGDVLNRVRDAVSQFFVRLTQVHNLQIEQISITPEMYAHLFQIPTLRTLRISRSPLTADPLSHPYVPPVGSLAIEDLRLDNDISGWHQGLLRQAWATNAMAHLAHRSAATLRKFTTGTFQGGLVTGLLGTPPHTSTFPSITELQFDHPGPTWPTFLRLLEACPNVESIVQARVKVQGGTILGTVAPSLKAISDFFDIAKALVPGRPVESITAQSYNYPAVEWTRDFLRPLASGTVPVKELKLQSLVWSPEGPDILFDLFPDVEILKVHSVGASQPWLKDNLLQEQVQRFQNLCVIHFQVNQGPFAVDMSRSAEELEEERRILDQATLLRPTLREVAFRNNGRWVKLDAKQEWTLVDSTRSVWATHVR